MAEYNRTVPPHSKADPLIVRMSRPRGAGYWTSMFDNWLCLVRKPSSVFSLYTVGIQIYMLSVGILRSRMSKSHVCQDYRHMIAVLCDHAYRVYYGTWARDSVYQTSIDWVKADCIWNFGM